MTRLCRVSHDVSSFFLKDSRILGQDHGDCGSGGDGGGEKVNEKTQRETTRGYIKWKPYHRVPMRLCQRLHAWASLSPAVHPAVTLLRSG